MRLPTRKIYRAFPELDHFSDEQCQRFINATRRGASFFLRWGIALVCGALVCAGLLTLFLYLTHPTRGLAPFRDGRASPWLFFGLGVVVASISGPLCGIVIRDWLLRRRVGRILRARGACVGCGYGLAGLPVNKNHQITCPECQLLCEVDPALGELSNESGVAIFQPNARYSRYRWWTPKRAARLGLMWRITWRATLIGLPASWGCYEIFLLLQANQAAAQKPKAAGILAIVESRQPVPLDPISRNNPDGWALMELALAKQRELESAHAPNPMPVVNSKPVFIDYWLIENDRISERFPTDEEHKRACLSVSLTMMEHLEAGGLFSQLDALAHQQRAVRPISFTASSPAVNTFASSFQFVRLCRINLARMHLALRYNDERSFIAACESNLAIARFISYQPSILDTTVALQLENMALNRLMMALNKAPSPSLVAGLKDVLKRQCLPRVPTYPWDAQHAVALDTVCWIFADTSHTRFGRFSPALRKFTLGFQQGKLGTFSGNKQELDRLDSEFPLYSSTPRAIRGAAPHTLKTPSDYLLVSFLSISLRGIPDLLDENELLRSGAHLMIALEEFRIATGSHPSSLTELVPTYFASLPIDPWSGAAIGYQLVDESRDDFRRPYLIYSVGHDQQDDQGLARGFPKPRSGEMRSNLFDSTHDPANLRRMGTSDFVINFPD